MTSRITAIVLLALGRIAAAAPPEADGVLIELDRQGNVRVKAADIAQVERFPPAIGLFVWSGGDGPERWAIVKPGWVRPTEDDPLDTTTLLAATRGGSESAG